MLATNYTVLLECLSDIASYPEEGLATLRASIARSAEKNSWFKNISAGEALGNYLFITIPHEIKTTELYKTFEKIKAWAINEQ